MRSTILVLTISYCDHEVQAVQHTCTYSVIVTMRSSIHYFTNQGCGAGNKIVTRSSRIHTCRNLFWRAIINGKKGKRFIQNLSENIYIFKQNKWTNKILSKVKTNYIKILIRKNSNINKNTTWAVVLYLLLHIPLNCIAHRSQAYAWKLNKHLTFLWATMIL